MTDPEKDLYRPFRKEMRTKGVPQTDLYNQIVPLLQRLDDLSGTEMKELSKLVGMLITENNELKKTIRKLQAKEAKILEVLKTQLGLDL